MSFRGCMGGHLGLPSTSTVLRRPHFSQFHCPFRLSLLKKLERKSRIKNANESKPTPQFSMDVLGLLRVRVRKGINLAVRDTLSSDPYCVISSGTQKVKTTVVRDNCNPVWNEELTICVKDLSVPVILSVFDKDTFTGDDSMGYARIDIEPLIECIRMELQGLPDGTKVDRVQPTRENCLADESVVLWSDGKMTQSMILRLKDVERGEVEVQIEWVDLPGKQNLPL